MDALPTRAVPTAALWMPVAGPTLRNSPDDVVALTEQAAVRSRLPQEDQLVMSIRTEDLVDRGLTYSRQNEVRVVNEVCPECGSPDAQRVDPADEPCGTETARRRKPVPVRGVRHGLGRVI